MQVNEYIVNDCDTKKYSNYCYSYTNRASDKCFLAANKMPLPHTIL